MYEDELVPAVFAAIWLFNNWLVNNALVKRKPNLIFAIALGFIVGFIYTYSFVVIVEYLKEGSFRFYFPNYFIYKSPPVTTSIIIGAISAGYFSISIKRAIANNEKLSGT